MNYISKIINDIPVKYFYVLIILLIFPALLINLDLLTMTEDESIRALVALEMKYSGNLIVPTLNNTFYYSKPPFYNWMLLLFYNIFQDTSSWTLRLVTVISLLLFAYIIFVINKKFIKKELALLIALVYVTSGRIMFWDSMIAYIDIPYSLITFVQIMLIYILHKSKNYWLLFVLSYLLMAIGFLMKGYTSPVFQGISLLVFFVWRKEFKKLFSIQHLAGITISIFIIGSYYFLYNQYNDITNTFVPLLDQSLRRTAVHESIDYISTIKHLFTYPFENIYHFLPWTLLVVLLFNKSVIKQIISNDFVAFNALMFLTNIVVYWVSVEVYPRYILMLTPMIFTVLIYVYDYNKTNKTHNYKVLNLIFSIIFVLISLSSFSYYFLEEIQAIDNYVAKTIFLNIAFLILTILFLFRKKQKLILMVLLVLVVRIGFDWFILPTRDRNKPDFDNQAIRIGNKYKNENIFLYKSSKVDYTASYYIARERGKKTTREFNRFEPSSYYYFDTSRYKLNLEDFNIVDEFMIREFDRTIFVVKPNKIIVE